MMANNFTWIRDGLLTEIVHLKTTAVDNALKGSDGNTLSSVHGHDNLPAILMTPFLVAAGLNEQTKEGATQNTRAYAGGK